MPTRPRAAPLSAWWGAGRRGVARSALDRDVCIARLVFTSEHTENDHEGTMCYKTSVSPGMLSGLPVIHPIHPRGSPHCLPDAQLLKVTVTTGLRRMTTARQTGCPGTLEMSPPRCLTGHLCLPAPPPSTSGPAAPLSTPARELPGRAGRQPCRLHSRPLTGSSWGTGPRPGGQRPSPSFPRRSAGPARPVPFLLLYSTTCLLSASWSIPHRLGGAAEPTASLGDGAPEASGSLAGRSTNEAPAWPRGGPGLAPPPAPLPARWLRHQGPSGGVLQPRATETALPVPEWHGPAAGTQPCTRAANALPPHSEPRSARPGPRNCGGAFRAPQSGSWESGIESAPRAKPAPLPDLASRGLEPPNSAPTAPRPRFASARGLRLGHRAQSCPEPLLALSGPEGSAHRPPPGRCPREADTAGPAHAPRVPVAFSRPPRPPMGAAVPPRPPPRPLVPGADRPLSAPLRAASTDAPAPARRHHHQGARRRWTARQASAAPAAA